MNYMIKINLHIYMLEEPTRMSEPQERKEQIVGGHLILMADLSLWIIRLSLLELIQVVVHTI